MAITWYCPVCWHHTTERLERCQKCGHTISSYEYESYEEKLMRSLSHPVREQRMIAIETLGRINHQPAIQKFDEIIRSDEDPFVIREVVRALYEMKTPECMSLLSSLYTHPSIIVREELNAQAGAHQCQKNQSHEQGHMSAPVRNHHEYDN